MLIRAGREFALELPRGHKSWSVSRLCVCRSESSFVHVVCISRSNYIYPYLGQMRILKGVEENMKHIKGVEENMKYIIRVM